MGKRVQCRMLGRTKVIALVASLLCLCLAGLLAFQGVQRAQADPLDLQRECSVQAQFSKEVLDKSNVPANLRYKMYKVADAKSLSPSDAYGFEATAPFQGLAEQLSNMPKYGSSDATATSRQISQSAAEIIFDAADDASKFEGFVTDVSYADQAKAEYEPGLYLLVAYGSATAGSAVPMSPTANVLMKNVSLDANASKYVSKAYADVYEFVFSPVLLSLPTRGNVANGTSDVFTSDTADWNYSPVITLKPELEKRTGPLFIQKALPEFASAGGTAKPATFVFEITWYESEADASDPTKAISSTTASIDFTAAGTQTKRVDGIPVGSYVVVKEVYSGTSYEVGNADPQSAIITLVNSQDDDGAAVVYFQNAYNDNSNKGGSVNNSFAFGEDGAWHWSKNGEPQDSGNQGGDR